MKNQKYKNEEFYEDQRPTLRIEQPPAWWIEKNQKEIENENKDLEENSRIIIIDLNSGIEKNDRDINGTIIINI